jgi:hypothetical protein
LFNRGSASRCHSQEDWKTKTALFWPAKEVNAHHIGRRSNASITPVGLRNPLPGACPGVAGTNYTHSPQKSLNLALLIDQHLYPIQMTFFLQGRRFYGRPSTAARGKSMIPLLRTVLVIS